MYSSFIHKKNRYSDKALFFLAMSTKGIVKQQQSLEIRNCSQNGLCDPPEILESGQKVWTNLLKSTHMDMYVLVEYKVDLPTPQAYIQSEGTRIGLDNITLTITTQRGKVRFDFQSYILILMQLYEP